MSISDTRNFVPSQFVKGSQAELLARLSARPTSVGTAGTAYVRADISTVVYSAYLDGTVMSSYTSQSLTVSTVFYNTLQGWPFDGTGFNFQHYLPVGVLATAGDINVVYTITLSATSRPIVLEFGGPCRDVPVSL